jgi:diguanylate cyclase (GGDEF)-like protein
MLSRPIDLNELADWLEDFTGRQREVPLSILIVDDEELLSESYSLALEAAGMRTVVAYDPADAISHITDSFPDLVLMDMNMPGASGLELAQIIRQSRRMLSLPIVFLSAERDPARQLAARKIGGDIFIPKPVDLERLVQIVRIRAERAIALRSIMERDSLTGLLNHARFKDRLTQELERCRRTGAELSLAILDLDHFKQVNDRFGHLAGDQVIRALAHTLTASLRRIDIIGRYGGEEFAVLLLDTPPEPAAAVIDRIRARFGSLRFGAACGEFSVTVSAGLAGSARNRTAEPLIAAADHCLYQAKRNGQNRVARE